MKPKPTTEKILIDFLLIALAIFIPYHQVAQHTFTDYDDRGYLLLNTHIMQGLSWDSVAWAFTSTEHANWHPLTWLSHLVDRELFGPHPGGYLLMNVGWHMLAACLAYFSLWRCTRSRTFALTVALIFAVHPVNVENVAWASERKSLLNAVFWFAAIVSYIDFIAARSAKAYGLTIVFFLLSLFSKATSVTLPCTLALVHWLYLVYHPDHPDNAALIFNIRVKRIVYPVLPLLILSAYFSVITALTQAVAMPENYPLADRGINALLSYQRYLVMFFHPTEFAVFYPLFVDSPQEFKSALPAILQLMAITSVAVLLARRKPQFLIGWCWFIGTLVPMIGLVQVGGQSHADRYLYVPMFGLAFVFPVLFEMIPSFHVRAKKVLVTGTLTVLTGSLMIASRAQVMYWKDGVTLCLHSLDVTGYCFNPLQILSVTCVRTERYDEFFSRANWYLANEVSPINRGLILTIKANVLYRMRKYSDAIATAQQAIDLGQANKAVYALIALSYYELYLPEEARPYLAKARSTPNLNSQNTLAIFNIDADVGWVEQQIKDPPSKLDPLFDVTSTEAPRLKAGE